ncbi:MAG TPA: nucleoside hydrolase [Nitrososphaeraceae archaeon]|nr:nucleoside hydrolase [Nitrososphaeraceae archaeon]
MSHKVILDVDPGIDDAIAIMTALRSYEIELIGIATVYGNVTPQVGIMNTLKVLESMNRMDIPVILGAQRPLMKDPLPNTIKKRKEIIHGKSGLGNLYSSPYLINEALKKRIIKGNMPSKITNHKNFIEFIDEINKHYRDGDISIIATGPLTNIAQAISYRPEFITKISQLSIMGGAYRLGSNITGNITKYAEFNFYCDPEAARVVLSSPYLNSKIKVVGLDVTQQPSCELNREFVNKVRQKLSIEKPSSMELILSLLDFKLSHYTVFHLHDVLAVLLHEKPSYFSFRRGNIEITLGGKLRGHTEFIDDRTSGNVQVTTAVKDHEFTNFLYNRLV